MRLAKALLLFCLFTGCSTDPDQEALKKAYDNLLGFMEKGQLDSLRTNCTDNGYEDLFVYGETSIDYENYNDSIKNARFFSVLKERGQGFRKNFTRVFVDRRYTGDTLQGTLGLKNGEGKSDQPFLRFLRIKGKWLFKEFNEGG